MSDACPICGGDTAQDGVWPVEDEGNVVDGCYACFQDQASDEWWAAVAAAIEDEQ